MSNRKVFTGQVYGLLTVVDNNPIVETDRNKHYRYQCRCECGKEHIVLVTHLRSGRITSCGCKRGIYKNHLLTYNSWRSMKQRCLNPKHNQYHNYGGRGIKIAPRWLDFANFLADMGERPSKGHSIDRKNNNGNYNKTNCRWATWEQQAGNRRRQQRWEYY